MLVKLTRRGDDKNVWVNKYHVLMIRELVGGGSAVYITDMTLPIEVKEDAKEIVRDIRRGIEQ